MGGQLLGRTDLGLVPRVAFYACLIDLPKWPHSYERSSAQLGGRRSLKISIELDHNVVSSKPRHETDPRRARLRSSCDGSSSRSWSCRTDGRLLSPRRGALSFFC